MCLSSLYVLPITVITVMVVVLNVLHTRIMCTCLFVGYCAIAVCGTMCVSLRAGMRRRCVPGVRSEGGLA